MQKLAVKAGVGRALQANEQRERLMQVQLPLGRSTPGTLRCDLKRGCWYNRVEGETGGGGGGEAGTINGTDLSLYKDLGFYSACSRGDLLKAFGRRTALI